MQPPTDSEYATWQQVNAFLSSFTASEGKCAGQFGHMGPAVYRAQTGVICMTCQAPIKAGDLMRGVRIDLQ